MNVVAFLEVACRGSGDRVALVSGLGQRRRELRFSQLDGRVGALVETLRNVGLQPGDRVLLAVPVSIETYVAMLAILRAGMVVMFVDPAHGAATVSRCLDEYPPAAVIVRRRAWLMRLRFPQLRTRPTVLVNGPGGAPRMPVPLVVRQPGDAALLTFTSGSTGTPKAVIRTHEFLRRQLAALRPVARLQEDDIDLVAMPMFVLFNLANVVTSVLPASGARRPGRADAGVLWAQLDAEKATRIIAAPALLERLADYCEAAGRTLGRLRCISTGGGPVHPALPDRLAAVAPRAVVKTVYGSSEAEPIAAIDHSEVTLADRERMRQGGGLLVGKPVEGCAVRIIGSDGAAAEITVAGRHVLSGDSDAPCWHRTGDAGYFDDQGRLWLLGRCTAAIIDRSGGRGTLYPFQIEIPVGEIDGINRAALLAIDGRRVLVLDIRPGRRHKECIRAAARVAGPSVDRIVVMRKIPMDRRHNSKIDYPALQAMSRKHQNPYRQWIAVGLPSGRLRRIAAWLWPQKPDGKPG